MSKDLNLLKKKKRIWSLMLLLFTQILCNLLLLSMCFVHTILNSTIGFMNRWHSVSVSTLTETSKDMTHEEETRRGTKIKRELPSFL